jgi:uncharacterized membrane protein
MSKNPQIILIVILFIYFAFTSGFLYWVTQYNKTLDLVIPFSWALSAEDTGLTGVATKDDLNCVQWLINESDKKVKIVADSNVIYLISGYLELVPDTWAMYGREDRFVTFHSLYKLDDFYIMVSSWNTRHGKMIETSDVGLRRQNKFLYDNNTFAYIINNHDDGTQFIVKSEKVKEIYRSGDAVVLQKQR